MGQFQHNLLALLLIFVLSLSSTFAKDDVIKFETPAKSEEAYVTLVYGEGFVLGARVLGRSLKESGTKRDMVALCTGDLSAASVRTLAMDGWRVASVTPVNNPGKGPQSGKGYPTRFWAVYTKLYIFSLTEYRKVVFLDADILVLKNMDAIFKCPGFCAALRHSERFNTGVMSLEPSTELFEDIMANIAKMPSYTGGDQGFLNSYFSGLANEPLFDPSASYKAGKYKYMRLPTTFNADVGLYVVGSNRWMIPRSSLFVIHYTLGTFKPWVWWTGWLVRENPAWDAVRARLPVDTRGYAGGRTPRQVFAEQWLVYFPWVTLIAVAAVAAYHDPSFFSLTAPTGGVQSWLAMTRRRSPGGGGPLASSTDAVLKQYCMHDTEETGGAESGMGAANGGGKLGGKLFPRLFLATNLLMGFTCLGVAAALTIMLVPPEVNATYGWILSYEYGFIMISVLYGLYLRVCYLWGERSRPTRSSTAGSQTVITPHQPWAATLGGAALFYSLLLAAPWSGRVLAGNSFVGNVVATVFTALPAVLFATLLLTLLPARWFLAGRLNELRFD